MKQKVKIVGLSNEERKVLKSFLQNLLVIMTRSGNNYLELENTPDNYFMLQEVIRNFYSGQQADAELKSLEDQAEFDKTLRTFDYQVLQYLIKKLDL
jgi:hypothetical protein